MKLRFTGAAGAALTAVVLLQARESAAQTPRLVFNGLAPCRVADTRQSAAGALAAGETRTFHVAGASADFAGQGGTAGGCGIPSFAGPGVPQAQAVAFNFVAVNPSGPGNLRAWASDQAVPNASILNYPSGLNLANGIVVPVRQDVEGGDLSLRADGSGAHVVIDVVGYYRYLTQLDGAGSGVDADALDGLDSSAFATAAHGHDSQYWKLDGNAGTTPGTHFLGTSDTQPLELRVNGSRAYRVEPGTFGPNILGGFSGNTINPLASAATIAGGGYAVAPNEVQGNHGTVGGGSGNVAGLQATVGGGFDNRATNFDSTVAGGHSNRATGRAATIPGGTANTAAGEQSFAAGRLAQASHDGAFVWGDFTNAPVASTGANQFVVRASGGIWLGANSAVSIGPGRFIDTSTGANLTTGGAWTNASDVRLKDGFAPVDGAAVLDAVARLPLSSWSYKAEGQGIRHLGPTAQDFRAAFGLGADDRSITTVDAAGVALAAIQELERRTREIEALSRQVDELRRRMETQARRPD